MQQVVAFRPSCRFTMSDGDSFLLFAAEKKIGKHQGVTETKSQAATIHGRADVDTATSSDTEARARSSVKASQKLHEKDPTTTIGTFLYGMN